MLNQKSALEVKIGERLYSLQLDSNSPLGEAYDALTQMRAYVIDRIIKEEEASKPKAADKPPEQGQDDL